jgi:uncharacterized membrane protein (DUF441 family)
MIALGDVLGPDTAIPIVAAWALMLGAIVVTIWLVRSIANIESQIKQLITAKDFYAWVYRLQKANPELKLPEDFP